jgi:hypothetical protein
VNIAVGRLRQELEMSDIVFKVAGHPIKDLSFIPYSKCGEITDGVCFSHGKEGGWVVAYKDLLKMVELSTKARAQPLMHPTSSAPKQARRPKRVTVAKHSPRSKARG